MSILWEGPNAPYNCVIIIFSGARGIFQWRGLENKYALDNHKIRLKILYNLGVFLSL